MTRGFLNSGKAKAKLTKDTDLIATADRPAERVLLKRSHGVVENAGRPDGYEARETILKERDALAPTEDFPDGWTECLLYPDTKSLILTTPGFPAPLVQPSSCSYRLAPSPDKGQGLFCTRKLSAGDLILSERPLTITPAWIARQMRFSRKLTAEEMFQAQVYEWEQTLKVLFDRLHPDYKTAFMALANSHESDGSGPIGGRIRTNGLGVHCLQTGRFTAEEERTSRQGVYSAVCRQISRLNHSCSPNTIAHFDLATFSYRLFAARDIPRGEELTLTYTSLHSLTEARQKELEPYGFQCSCSACRSPSQSDARRALSISISMDNVDDCLEKLSLLEDEGLEATPEYCKTLKSLVDLYFGLGDAKSVGKYARKLVSRPWSSFADSARSYATS
ncbi:hypothetical protein B0H11DRAFT_1987551 [Mycena galericulata]|nr:hypothetical protein B0H11DRAFT_1987551 [Mycena galericulata]